VTPISERARTAQRSLVVTLEIVALAAGAHVLAGGHLPAPVFLLALAAVVFAGAVLSIGRFVRVRTVVPFVLAAQVGLHAGLEATRPTHSGMAMPAHDTGFLGTTPTMFWAHLVTALIAAIILLLQERVLAAVVTWFGVHVAVAAIAPLRSGAPVLAVRTSRPRQALLRLSPRRGPPQALAASS
jgi:hypothetical protein